MAITPDQIEAGALAPQSVTIDGNTATQQSWADVLGGLNYANHVRAIQNGKPAARFFKLIPPGAVTIGRRSYGTH